MSSRDEVDDDDRPLHELDDRADRDELRQRYYGLLQELRVILPGVQLLGAFLLTVPFAQGFDELDRPGRVAYGISLTTALLSVVCLLTPTVYHRVASRAERTARLRWGIRLTLVGMVLLAVSLVTGLWCVSRLVFGSLTAWLLSILLLATIVLMWMVLPRATGRDPDPRGA
jgi:Family of unknown function (DUF6328)